MTFDHTAFFAHARKLTRLLRRSQRARWPVSTRDMGRGRVSGLSGVSGLTLAAVALGAERNPISARDHGVTKQIFLMQCGRSFDATPAVSPRRNTAKKLPGSPATR